MSRGGNQVPILIERQGRPRARAEVINVRESPPSGRMASPFPRQTAWSRGNQNSPTARREAAKEAEHVLL